MEKIFSFRWDIDHLHGLEKGVPSILSVCRKHNVKCSFYINLGKSFDFREWMFKSIRKSYDKLRDSASVSMIQKLGYTRLLHLIVVNPNVGLRRVDILRAIIDEGHELGLHGGMNHMLWSRRICDFTEDRIEQMLQEAIFEFEKEVGKKIFGFAAPGFRWSKASLACLDRLGFAYSGDQWGDKPFYPVFNGTSFKHLCIPVTLIGPNTVPMIEHHAALGKSDNDIGDIVCREISKKKFAVIYGHPVFEGFKSDLLKKIFEFVLKNGYTVLRHDEIYERFKNISPGMDVSEQSKVA